MNAQNVNGFMQLAIKLPQNNFGLKGDYNMYILSSDPIGYANTDT